MKGHKRGVRDLMVTAMATACCWGWGQAVMEVANADEPVTME